jgi:hypothetical protein
MPPYLVCDGGTEDEKEANQEPEQFVRVVR